MRPPVPCPGAYFVATAIGAPIAGRRVDRHGQARILFARALIFPALLATVCALALSDASIGLIGAAAAAAGVLMPPVGASLRSLWPRMFADAELRAAAYALEASLQEITFIVGPLLVALLTAAGSPALALGVAAAAGGVGTLSIALAAPVRAWRPEAERHASILERSSRAASSRWSASPPASASASAAPRWAFPPLPSSTAARSSGASPCRSSRAAASSAGSWSAHG